MKMTFAEIAAATGSPAPATPGTVGDWSIDTRTLGGEAPLYIALRARRS
jgi:hypothetical protein